MANENHTLGIASLIISAIIGSVYITREISADKEIKSRIDSIKLNKEQSRSARWGRVQHFIWGVLAGGLVGTYIGFQAVN